MAHLVAIGLPVLLYLARRGALAARGSRSAAPASRSPPRRWCSRGRAPPGSAPVARARSSSARDSGWAGSGTTTRLRRRVLQLGARGGGGRGARAGPAEPAQLAVGLAVPRVADRRRQLQGGQRAGRLIQYGQHPRHGGAPPAARRRVRATGRSTIPTTCRRAIRRSTGTTSSPPTRGPAATGWRWPPSAGSSRSRCSRSSAARSRSARGRASAAAQRQTPALTDLDDRRDPARGRRRGRVRRGAAAARAHAVRVDPHRHAGLVRAARSGEIPLTRRARRGVMIAVAVVGALFVGAERRADRGDGRVRRRRAPRDGVGRHDRSRSYRIRMLLGRAWARAGRCDRAIPHANAARELFPEPSRAGAAAARVRRPPAPIAPAAGPSGSDPCVAHHRLSTSGTSI